jgi:hypothetical protein
MLTGWSGGPCGTLGKESNRSPSIREDDDDDPLEFHELGLSSSPGIAMLEPDGVSVAEKVSGGRSNGAGVCPTVGKSLNS